MVRVVRLLVHQRPDRDGRYVLRRHEGDLAVAGRGNDSALVLDRVPELLLRKVLYFRGPQRQQHAFPHTFTALHVRRD